MSDFIIGVSDLEGKSFNSKKWFYLEANKPNVFRVLPPVLSCAATREYYRFYAIHRNMRSVDGFQKSFVCPERSDRETRVITRRCSICDQRRQNEIQYKTAKDGGQISEENLKKFYLAKIEPLQVERKYFLNVVNQAGEIGILGIPSKLKNDLVDTLKRIKESKGIDATGIKGIFFDFQKTSQFKGDKNVIYKAVPFMETVDFNGTQAEVFKTHEITNDFKEKMKAKCSDLNTIHSELTADQINSLAQAQNSEERANLLAIYFPRFNSKSGSGITPQPVDNLPGVFTTTEVSLKDGHINYEMNNRAISVEPTVMTKVTKSETASTLSSGLGSTVPVSKEKAATVSTGATQPVPELLSQDEFMKLFLNN